MWFLTIRLFWSFLEKFVFQFHWVDKQTFRQGSSWDFTGETQALPLSLCVRSVQLLKEVMKCETCWWWNETFSNNVSLSDSIWASRSESSGSESWSRHLLQDYHHQYQDDHDHDASQWSWWSGHWWACVSLGSVACSFLSYSLASPSPRSPCHPPCALVSQQGRVGRSKGIGYFLGSINTIHWQAKFIL